MSSLKYWIWLSSLSGIGSVTAVKLINHFGSPEKVFEARNFEYRDVDGVSTADAVVLAEKNLDGANSALASCTRLGYRILTLHDAEYPDRLRNIYDPPIVLYIRGGLPLVDEEAVVSIVGTRNCTPYGISAAENLGYTLAKHGLVVSTGLARGIDTAAARGALKGGGRVVGVVGSGLDIVYPYENRELFEGVAASGAIVSEYKPGAPAVRTHFPARNRIVSGLSLGVAVIEAPKRSGALITASRALEQGRDVFVIPGNIDARSCEGSNALLREGAIPILSGEDIVSEYTELFPDKIHDPASFDCDKKGIDNNSAVDYIDLDKILSELVGDERSVAQAIGLESVHIDEITVKTGMTAQRVMTALTMLEVNGAASQKTGKRFSLNRRNE